MNLGGPGYEPVDRLGTDQHGQDQEPASIDERRPGGGLGVAAWACGGRWSFGEPDGKEGDTDGGGIGEVVDSLGQDAQRVGSDTNDNEAANQTKIEAQDNPQASCPAQLGRFAHRDSLVV